MSMMPHLQLEGLSPEEADAQLEMAKLVVSGELKTIGLKAQADGPDLNGSILGACELDEEAGGGEFAIMLVHPAPDRPQFGYTAFQVLNGEDATRFVAVDEPLHTQVIETWMASYDGETSDET